MQAPLTRGPRRGSLRPTVTRSEDGGGPAGRLWALEPEEAAAARSEA